MIVEGRPRHSAKMPDDLFGSELITPPLTVRAELELAGQLAVEHLRAEVRDAVAHR